MRKNLILLMLCAVCACAPSRSATKENYSSPQFVSGTGLEKTEPDRDAVRRIVLVYPNNGEKLDVVYYSDKHYDSAAMKKINKLMRDRHSNNAGKIDPELIDFMVDIRKRLSLPETVPFQILSGYRSAITNKRLAKKNKNVAKDSLHKYGWAVDFRIEGVNGKAICEIAKTMQRGGVAYYPKDNHVHVDLGNIRTWQEKRTRRK
ncbi:MAG: DUF882 domain-containing protein [Bdellovibrionales bacterium]